MNTLKIQRYNYTNCELPDDATPREREFMRRIIACMPRTDLICPDDEGLIRATLSNTMSGVISVNALAAGGTASMVLPALGLNYCIGIGLEQNNLLVAADNYTVTIVRSGQVVATYMRQELLATTANDKAGLCPCNTCVGRIQTATLVITNTGAAAFAANATLNFKVCRDFTEECYQRMSCGGCG